MVWHFLDDLSDMLAGWLDFDTYSGYSGRSKRVTAPDLAGLDINDARYNAMRAGVKLDIVLLDPDPPATRGFVAKQDPAPGKDLRRDATVTVWLDFPPQ
ncbi:PASTA domain-containing protein [Streptosporangiaceae bacterium NEAU-GS5]|nr:PASTA domain-containing protein [Streptosporangiaceae bacterium NEAU-GS5]